MGKDYPLIISEFVNTEQSPLCLHSDETALEISLSFISIYSSKLIKRKRKKNIPSAKLLPLRPSGLHPEAHCL